MLKATVYHGTFVMQRIIVHNCVLFADDFFLNQANEIISTRYMQFMGTLAETGYSGDVVLAIAEHRIISDDVEDYLRTFVNDANKPNIVVYQHVLSCDNLDEPGKRKVNKRSKETDTFQMCNLPRVYGWKDAMTGKILNTAHDPRRGRVVATIRYEWYWIWSQQYDSHSWIMLLDSRDSFFQSNPFVDLPRQNNASQRKDGLLYFFGENSDATRLGKSNKNAKWLLRGYGPEVLKALENKPTICSGSTMGEQVALETYLRALVQEHDESVIKMTGSDQGFHNYLYYSNKLRNAATIRRLVVWEQGRGIINNVGAMRTKPLEEWGIYNPETHEVFQWDGKTLSPVVHQWDRDAHLHNHIVRQKHKKLKIEWERQKVAK